MSKRRDAVIGWAVLVGSILSLIVVAFIWSRDQPAEEAVQPKVSPKTQEAREYLANAEEAYDQGAYRAARKLADTALSLDEGLTEAALLAGNASIEFKDIDKAIGYFDRVPSTNRPSGIRALFGKARAQYLLGSHAVAETELRDLLKTKPDHSAANDLLAELLDVHGRRWDSVPYAIEVARQGRSSLEALILLADREFVVNPNNRAARAIERFDEPGPKLGLARAAFDEGDAETGAKILPQALSPVVESQLVYFEYLLNNDLEEFQKRIPAIPDDAEAHPRYWFVIATYADRQDQTESAARCFWEVLKRDPNHRAAHFRLARVLQAIGRDGDAKPFVDRGLQLARLKKVLEPVIAAGNDSNTDEITDVIVALEALGRNIEARAWEAWMLKQMGETHKFEPIMGSVPIEQRLSQWVDADARLADQIDLSEYPLPRIEQQASASRSETNANLVARFEDQAVQSGINFTFVAAPDDQTEGKRIIELTGGGVGAFDFDLDAWPDMFFTQGGLIPTSNKSLHDRLFRNTAAGSRQRDNHGDNEVPAFADVTDLSGLGSSDFGQGMAIADFNSDGFPDVFVGNLGRNRLFVNNGDGTFKDVTDILRDEHEDWTTSCVFADFNNDSLPDLYVTNYLGGDDLTSRICRLVETAKPRMCTPDQFPAAQDRVFLNRGDGSFEDKTEGSGITLPQGKGLGVLAADFDFSNSLQLFVANDGVANFFFDIHPVSFTFTDVAATVGLAMSGDGLAQACMGVAAGDVNSDGRPDLFVTNFDREPNTLYLNDAGLFDDSTRASKLHEPGFRMLGFGTQFVDGNLDGEPDLIVTNGHVDDFSHQGTAYRMRPQYFRNATDVRFAATENLSPRRAGPLTFLEVDSNEIGEWFDRPQLGRGLCRIDWNRDGREDIAISHLDTPAALLTNVSKQTGHSITVRLVGESIDRDATGSKVFVNEGSWFNSRQLVAGDGYLCSNQKQLVFGLGDREQVSALHVRWIDGTRQTVENLRADNEYIIRQGIDGALAIPR